MASKMGDHETTSQDEDMMLNKRKSLIDLTAITNYITILKKNIHTLTTEKEFSKFLGESKDAFMDIFSTIGILHKNYLKEIVRLMEEWESLRLTTFGKNNLINELIDTDSIRDEINNMAKLYLRNNDLNLSEDVRNQEESYEKKKHVPKKMKKYMKLTIKFLQGLRKGI